MKRKTSHFGRRLPVQVTLAVVALFMSPWTGVAQTAGDAPVANSDPQAITSFRNAVALQNRELYDLAEAEWAALLEKFPNDPLAAKAQHYQGVCLFQLERYDEAAATFAKLISQGPPDELAEQTYANLGLARYNQAQAADPPRAASLLDASIATLGRQLEAFPDGPLAPQARFYRGEALYARGKTQEAAAEYRHFVEQYRDNPLRPLALYGLGVAEQQLQQYQQAESTFVRFLKEYPQHESAADVTLRLGESLFATGEFAAAEKQFAEAASIPNFADADYALEREARCRYEQQNYAAAAALYAALPNRFPESSLVAEATLAAGKCYYLAGDTERAIEWLGRARQGDELAEATHWLARAQLKLGQAEKAIDAVESTLAAAEQSDWLVQLKLDRADALYDLEPRRPEALEAYANIAAEHPNHELAPQASYLAAYTALELAQYEAALEHARAFLERYESDDYAVDVRNVAAESHLQLGQHRDAASEFQRLVEQHPDHADWSTWLVRLALSESLNKQWPAVVTTLEPHVAALDNPAQRAEAGLLLGRAYAALEKHQQAIDVLTKTIDQAGDWPRRDELLYRRAVSLHAAGDVKQAVRSLDRLLDELPDRPLARSARLLRATWREQLGDYTGSIQDADALLATEPPQALASAAMYVRGLSEAALEDYDRAAETFRSILQVDPDYASADLVLYEWAWAHQNAGRTSEATATFHTLAKRFPDSPLAAECWYRVGEAQLGAQQFAAAAESFAAAHTGANDNRDLAEKALHKRAWTRFRQRKYDESEKLFADQLAAFPQGPLAGDGRVMLAESLFEQHKYQAAVDAFDEALRGDASPSLEAIALLHAGQSAAQLDQWERSLELVDRCLTQHGNMENVDQARYEKGWALYHLKRFDDALPLFRQVADADLSSLGARARFMVGESLFAQKKYDDAVRAYFKVAYGYGDRDAPADLHRWQSEAMFEAARCLEQTGRDAAARKLYRELLERFPQSDKALHARNQLQRSASRN